jgi:hypothetical protein
MIMSSYLSSHTDKTHRAPSPVRKVIAVMPRRPTFPKHTNTNTRCRKTVLLPAKSRPSSGYNARQTRQGCQEFACMGQKNAFQLTLTIQRPAS